jgi:hypothetical protein
LDFLKNLLTWLLLLNRYREAQWLFLTPQTQVQKHLLIKGGLRESSFSVLGDDGIDANSGI